MSRWGALVVRSVAVGTVLTGAATLGGVGISVAWADTNLVVNGSFEDPPVTAVTYYDSTTAPGITGWTVGATGSVEQDPILSNTWPADDGNISVDLSGDTSAGSISQDVPTTSGTQYTLSFALGGNPNCNIYGSNPVKVLGVYWDGSQLATETFDSTNSGPSAMNWAHYSLTVTGDSSAATTELEFADLTSGDGTCGPVIDSVSVTPTPGTALPEAPFTIGLPLAAVGVGAGILFLRRRRAAA